MKTAKDRALDAAYEMSGKVISRLTFEHIMNNEKIGEESRKAIEVIAKHIELDRAERAIQSIIVKVKP